MKIQIASDLHLEGRPGHLPPPDAFAPDPDRDVLVLAGDIGRHLLARDFVLRELAFSPVVYVPGNHEYYGRQNRASVDGMWGELAAAHPGLHYLIAEGVDIEGVRFWGAPWYSDLWGSGDARLHKFVERGINDFGARFNGLGDWSLSRHVRCHAEQTALLRARAGGVDVVVTHWPPTRGAMHPRFEGDILNPYFYNDREDLVREVGAQLWVSGHTHEAYDYAVGRTRCIGNPTGYAMERRWSDLFRPDRTVEVLEQAVSRP